MANIRLTKVMREDAISAALAEVFKDQIKLNVNTTVDLALCAHREQFGKEVEAMKNVDENKWLKHVNSLTLKTEDEDGKNQRDFYFLGVGDYNSRRSIELQFENNPIVANVIDRNFKVTDVKLGLSVPVPYSNGGYVTIKKATQLKTLIKIRDERNCIVKEMFVFYKKLNGFLAACKTVADVQTNWPEGTKFFPTEIDVKTNLPIPLIDDIRAKMRAVKTK